MADKTVHTAGLTGPALSWAVAQCVDLPGYDRVTVGYSEATGYFVRISDSTFECELASKDMIYSPVSDWRQGGALIERYQITLGFDTAAKQWVAFVACPDGDGNLHWSHVYGRAALEAVCHAVVHVNCGYYTQVPTELI